MKIFKDYTYKWWEIGIFKLGMFLLGAIVGAYWADFFIANVVVVGIIAAVAVIYVSYISFKK